MARDSQRIEGKEGGFVFFRFDIMLEMNREWRTLLTGAQVFLLLLVALHPKTTDTG